MKEDLARIEQFLDALWLERNLAENTLSAYRLDLTMVVEWLHHRGSSLVSVSGEDLQARRPWLGPLLLALGVALAFAPPWQGLPLGAYAAVALLLVGGIVTVPLLRGGVLGRRPGARQPILLLALERARDQRDSATITVAGVVASLALSVALTVMVASFRDSVTGWLD